MCNSWQFIFVLSIKMWTTPSSNRAPVGLWWQKSQSACQHITVIQNCLQSTKFSVFFSSPASRVVSARNCITNRQAGSQPSIRKQLWLHFRQIGKLPSVKGPVYPCLKKPHQPLLWLGFQPVGHLTPQAVIFYNGWNPNQLCCNDISIPLFSTTAACKHEFLPIFFYR